MSLSQGAVIAARGKNAVHTLPRDWQSLAHVLTPMLERVDPLNSATQLLVVTPDVESTVALVAGAFAHYGVQGIDLLPATGAARTSRLLRINPAQAVAGPPWVLRELLGTSTLQLDSVQAILLAWVEDLIEEGGEPLTDLEMVLAEAPKEAPRVLVVREIAPSVDRFIDRHLHQARRVGTAGASADVRLPVSYVTTPRISRPAALRRTLDELDPPSAAVVVRADDSEAEARLIVRQLGYRRPDDVVRVTRGEVPANTHTVILYDAPDPAALSNAAAASPARVVALLEPRELASLRRITGGRAVPLERPAGHHRARRSDELLRSEIRELLEAGFGVREISAIEPLLAEFDAAEVAGALVRLLERERERRAMTAAPAPLGERRQERPSEGRGARPDRGPRPAGTGRGSRPPERGGRGGRGPDDRRGPPAGERGGRGGRGRDDSRRGQPGSEGRGRDDSRRSQGGREGGGRDEEDRRGARR